MGIKSVYIVSLNSDWSAVVNSVLSSIFHDYRFCECDGVNELWSLSSEDVVVFDKGTLGNPSSLLISPYERGGEWLIVNGNPVDEESVAGLISLGYSGLIVAPYTLEMLPRALRTIAGGQMWFSRDAMSQALKHLVKAGGMSCHSVNVLGARFSLSSREQQVFLLLLQGKSNKDIALQLHLSPSTVKCHVSNILLKTGKNSRNQLTTLLLEEEAA
ncbi:response regulator transcription factor [Enterovibrio sp. ZSDZ35]|uniref:Response regulator transcription factor n=1 Tax=Enterovibrio qingdaonensis TaxID=2899818 RepID=A0ABT5QSZ9_9GAMM|nr:response regulator transcription factor [Enterovibrio sp. ZSDZ35]MDD1784106.1 response regulator transcription factor [Enterovibrio sp. ZSDZ35]